MKTIAKSHIKAMVGVVCTGVLTLAAAPSGSAQNLIYNPQFSSSATAPNPNPTGVQAWAEFGGAAYSQNYSREAGGWSLYTPDSGGGYSVPGAYEVFGASPGETFTLSAWVYTPNVLPTAGNDFAILQLSPFSGAPPSNYAGGTGYTASGVNIGQPAGGGGVPLPQGVWTFASVTATMPAGTGSLGVYLLDINADANADIYFDDVSLTAAPEPTTLSLAGLGLLGLMGSRLRRRI
jgi:hypothetical protein